MKIEKEPLSQIFRARPKKKQSGDLLEKVDFDKIFNVFKAVMIVFTALSYLFLLIYCLSKELPFIEVAKDLGVYVLAFSLVSAFTIFWLSGMFLVLLAVREANVYREKLEKISFISEFLNSSGIGVSVILYAVAISFKLNLIISSFLMLLIFVLCFLNVITLLKKMDLNGEKIYWLRFLGNLLIQNFMSMVLFFVLILFVDKFVIGVSLLGESKFSKYLYFFSVTLLSIFVFVFLLFLNRKPVEGKSFIPTALVTATLVLLFSVSGLALGTADVAMKQLKKGGNADVVLLLKRDVVCSGSLRPDSPFGDDCEKNQKNKLGNSATKDVEKFLQTNQLKLVYLTDQAVYLRKNETSDLVVLKRADVSELSFKE